MLKKVFKRSHVHILFVFIAFALMVAIGSIFVNSTLEKSSLATITTALEETEKTIRAYLREPRVLFNSIFLSIQDMLDRGETPEAVQEFMRRTTTSLSAQESDIMGFVDVYGFLRNELLTGMEWDDVGDDYVPQQRPWYQSAIRNDEVEYTAPYIDAQTGLPVMSLVQMMHGQNGEYYGVLAMDIDISWLMQYAESLQFVEGGYGMIVTQYLYVVAHPNEENLNLRLQDLGESYAVIANMLRTNNEVFDLRIRDSDDSRAIVFFKELYNGWHVGVIVPTGAYYSDLRLNMIVLITLGLALSIALSYILLRLTAERARSEEESKSKSSFLAMMSHEIRTPMNSIIGITEILRHNETLPTGVEEGLDRIYTSCDMLLGIINGILDLSKIESSKMDITPVQYEIANLINDSAHLNMMRIGSKQVSFEMAIDDSIPRKLYGDELRIKQILNNILSNAFKYTESGKVVLSVISEPMPGEEVVALVFRVQDTGHGMTKEQLDNLFIEYSRFTQDSGKTIEGTGLGLTITKKLITLMGGAIDVESEHGKGTMVTIRLPQIVVDTESLGTELAGDLMQFRTNHLSKTGRGKIIREPMPYGSVLIVDDVDANLYVATGLMKPYKLQIETATGGLEAITKVKSGRTYDLIFMDHMMPDMDGIEATKKLRSMGYEGPIVALTANAVVGQKDIFLQNGFDDFISKPIDIRVLDSTLKKLIRDKQPQDVIEAAKGLIDESIEEAQSAEDADDNWLLSALRGISEINADIGLSHVSGIMEMYRVTLEMLYKKLVPECSVMSASLESGDLHGFSITVHAMKSMLATVGAKALSDIAFKLETASKGQDSETCESGYPELQQKLMILKEKLSAIFPDEEVGETEKEQGDMDLLDENIKKALVAAEEFDNDTGIEAIKELMQYDYGSETANKLDNAIKALEDFDFDTATDILSG